MKKYGDAQKIEQISEEEVEIIRDHATKTGKTISNLDDEERDQLHQDLDEI